MHKTQRETFLRYLEQAGAIVEQVKAVPSTRYSSHIPRLTVTGGNLRVSFFDADEYVGRIYIPFDWWFKPRAAKSLNVDSSVQKGDPPPALDLSDKVRNWTHFVVSRQTSCGEYRHTIKEGTIRRAAAPLKELAVYFASQQGQTTAHAWTPDAIERFDWQTQRGLYLLAKMHEPTPLQERAARALYETANQTAPYLERGQQPPDDLVRAFDAALRKYQVLIDDGRVLDNPKLDALPG